MKHIGFSTGAIALGDFRTALVVLSDEAVDAVELSALRFGEVETLISAISSLDLKRYACVSFHAPSSFSQDQEAGLAEILYSSLPENWPVVLHPDSIFDYSNWKRFGRRLAIENMDRRKPLGRTAKELAEIFALLPDASLCFDVGHARQFDSSMTEAYLILSAFASRLVQVHVSEVNSASQHERVSYAAKLGFQEIGSLLPAEVPLILESRVTKDEIRPELTNVMELFDVAGCIV